MIDHSTKTSRPSPRAAHRSWILALLLCGIAWYLPAQEIQPEKFYKKPSKFSFDLKSKQTGGPVRWTADKQEFVKEDYVLLEGNVKIYYQDVVIAADKITHNLKTRDIEAQGHVVLDQGVRRLSGERVVFNLDTKTGTLFNAKGAFEPSVYFTGEKIEKIDEDTYRLTNGVFTSCDLENPSWSFHLKSGEVTVEDYARLRGISFRARRVPLFWTPYLLWPTKKDRSQGLLIPKIGVSNRFGAYLGAAYFLPFGQSADTTIHFDYYSKGFHSLGTSVNYVPTADIDGKMTGYVARDPVRNKIEWRYEYKHTQENLPGDFRGVVDVQDYSNLEFFRSFERNFRTSSISSIYSSAYLTKNRPTYAVNIRTDRREHFDGAQSKVFEQLPALQWTRYPNRIASSPFYFSLESSTSHLRTSEGGSYYRGDFYPTVSMQLRTPSWFSLKPQLSLRETFYTSSLDEMGKIEGTALSRFYAQAQVELVGPSLSRIYQKDVGGFNRFKHVIEPRFRYLYTTNVENQNQIIRFDTVDTPFLPIVRDTVEYSLTQRLLAKEKKEGSGAREIMSFSIKQTVALSQPFDRPGTGPVEHQRFTPLTLNAHVNPYQSVTIDANANFGNQSRQLDQLSLAANLHRAQTYLSTTWFATFLKPGETTGNASQFRVQAGSPLLRDRFRADVQLNFDAERGRFNEQRYIVGFNASCYNIAFEYRDFIELRGVNSPRNQDYQISVNLKNVGTFVDLRGSLDALF